MRCFVSITVILSCTACSGADDPNAHSPTTPPAPDIESIMPDAGSLPDTAIDSFTDVPITPAPFTPPEGTPPALLGGTERPAIYHLPKQYTHDSRWPLVILLHGYSASGIAQDGYMAMSTKLDDKGFILITPDGTPDEDGFLHWNATDACCDFFGKGVDDVSYIADLIDEAATWFNVDAERISVLGHSNGGYMTFRVACDLGDRLASAMSIAGGMWLDDTKCPAPGQLSMVVVHSTNDDDVAYNGSTQGDRQYKGALESTEFWANRNACGASLDYVETVDLVSDTEGAETEIYRHTDCANDTAVEHWKMLEAGHEPDFTDGVFSERALDFLLNARRPAPQ